MKYILTLSFFFLTGTAHAFLTPEQNDSVMKRLDQTCGDAWCEGEFQVRFENLKCSRTLGLCHLEMSYSSGESSAMTHAQSCLIERVRHVDDLLKDFGTNSERLNAPITVAVQACVDEFYQKISGN